MEFLKFGGTAFLSGSKNWDKTTKIMLDPQISVFALEASLRVLMSTPIVDRSRIHSMIDIPSPISVVI